MPVSFSVVAVSGQYSRNKLADLWGYSSYHAIARGVVTPRDDNKIILFVTEEKQSSLEQYADRLVGHVLHWEGPNDHFAEERMACASTSGDEIHLFHRSRHHSDFVYMGKVAVLEYSKNTFSPSQFKLKIAI
jgi:hypothetical protein